VRTSVARAVVLLAALVASGAWAWPVDVAVTVKNKDVHFEHPAAIAWAESADPSIATIEVLRSGEVLVSGRSPGQTVALLYAEGKMGVWRLTVTEAGEVRKAAAHPMDAAKKACPTLKLGEKGTEEALSATLPDEKCREALLEVLKTDAFNSHELSLTFTVPALQGQLGAITKAIAPFAPQVKASYVGAGLVLEGKVSEAQHRKVLWEAFRQSVGRVPLEDRMEVEKPATSDAGTP
jgi:Flp pilus assembly secretin CpaC